MYREHPAPRELADVVDAFWTRSVAAPQDGRSYRVLPDGCIDVIVHLVGSPRVEVVGAMTRALVVPDGPSDIVAVRFRPGPPACSSPRPPTPSPTRASLPASSGCPRRRCSTSWRRCPTRPPACVTSRAC
ncbi:DUF6597 domain-containing transcriptional factor [Nannocystis pusilla]|uniref:DUF6597 domain-containing transcriptional factor n=1 Tax=Nannocystis pusilla TaxID=889268 RepID=UPI003B8211E0